MKVKSYYTFQWAILRLSNNRQNIR